MLIVRGYWREMQQPGGPHQVKSLPAMLEIQETRLDPWVGNIPWRRKWYSAPVFLPRKSPWTEKPEGLHSTGSQRVRHKWAHGIYIYTERTYGRNLLFAVFLGKCTPQSVWKSASWCNNANGTVFVWVIGWYDELVELFLPIVASQLRRAF